MYQALAFQRMIELIAKCKIKCRSLRKIKLILVVWKKAECNLVATEYSQCSIYACSMILRKIYFVQGCIKHCMHTFVWTVASVQLSWLDDVMSWLTCRANIMKMSTAHFILSSHAHADGSLSQQRSHISSTIHYHYIVHSKKLEWITIFLSTSGTIKQ